MRNLVGGSSVQRLVPDRALDVWALGVLLYKLCYYTTPFEKHGPPAILRVQYNIPPYPVYSPRINALICEFRGSLGQYNC